MIGPLGVVLLCLFALWMALVEIEIEGDRGWAERLPTWFRVGGPAGRLYGLVANGRPLTGYHLFMATLPLIAFHLPFGFGVDWSLGREIQVLAIYPAWAVAWDYVWFVLNPAYTVARFRRGLVWWYPGPWVGRFPLDYPLAVALSFAMAALAWAAGAGSGALAEQAWLVGGLLVTCALAVVLAPAYRRWYAFMRRPGSDERERAGITPPPGGEE